jgi:tetratricopeptide (TPR) repeat protein
MTTSSPFQSQERTMPFSVRSLLAAAAVVGLAMAPLPAARAQMDVVTVNVVTTVNNVVTVSKKSNRGMITNMTAAEVTLDMAGLARKFAVNEINKIAFADEPTDLTAARNSLDQKNYNSAKDQLDKINPAKVERELISQDIAFYKAYCLARLALTEGGNKSDASKAMFAFYQTAPNNYHFYEAAEILGDLGVATGSFEAAAKFYGETGLGGAPWPEYKLRAGVASGRALVLAGKFEDAAKAFDAVSASGETTSEANALKQHALVGKAHCLAETGKPEEGITILSEIVAKNDPQLDSKLFARAYNALGNCYLKQTKPKDALMAFLKTDLLFFADSDAHAEALSKLAKLWEETGHAERATDARNKLRDRYSGSIWASK